MQAVPLQKTKFKCIHEKGDFKECKGKVDLICKLNLKPVVISNPLEILPARGTRPNKQKINVNVFLKKSDLKECKTNLECRKVKCAANSHKNWVKSTKYASCTSSR